MKTKEQLLTMELHVTTCKLRGAKADVRRLDAERTRILKEMAQTVIRELQAGVSL